MYIQIAEQVIDGGDYGNVMVMDNIYSAKSCRRR